MRITLEAEVFADGAIIPYVVEGVPDIYKRIGGDYFTNFTPSEFADLMRERLPEYKIAFRFHAMSECPADMLNEMRAIVNA